MENEVSRVLRLRRSVRSFTNQEVEDEKIMKILEAAYWAPSAGGLHWVNIILVRGKEKILKVLSEYPPQERFVNSDIVNAILEDDACKRYIRSASVMILVCTDVSKYKETYDKPIKGALSKWRDLRMGELFAVNDADLAALNMALQSHALGIGVCWIGHINGEKLRELFEIDKKDIMPVCILLMGYPDKKGERKIQDIIKKVEEEQKSKRPVKARPDDIFKEETFNGRLSKLDSLKKSIEEVRQMRNRIWNQSTS